MTPPRHEPTGWHLKREIQLGHLLTTLAIAASVAMYVIKMDQRLSLAESVMANHLREQKERDERQDTSVREAMTLLRNQLQRMDEKLDRLIERRGQQGISR